jgi:hypothetical protein
MGYYSDVALALSAEAEKAFQEALNGTSSEVRVVVEAAELHKDEGNTLRLWKTVKWYPEFPEVEFVMKFIADLDTSDPEAYHFISLGEDADDVEDRGSFYASFRMYWTRKICFDAPEHDNAPSAPQPADAPVPPRTDLLQVRKCLDISLSHIPHDDFENLDREVRYEGEIIVYRKDRGYFIHVPLDNTGNYLGLLFERGFSDAFRYLIQVASGLGCDWIVADADVKISAALPVFG